MDTLGRYNVFEDQSGQEGGWRWRKAFNPSLRCYVALAVIPKAAFPSEESRQQFEAEVQIANFIHHGNVAATFPLEVINDSYLYAMEYCDGETLAARIMRSGSIETGEALEITRQIAAGLEAASSAGLLHRNVIAGNVVVLEEDDGISVKVCGLGLPAGGSDVSIASPERDFRSPEEIAGKDFDVRSSIYSIGALLYFMGAGREAYQEFFARSLAGETQDVVPEQVPHPIRMVLRRSLCQNATERFGTFAELIEEVDRALIAPEQPEVQEIAIPARVDETPEQRPPATPSPEIEEKPMQPIELREDELMIPVELLGVAQPGTVLRLNPVEAESRPEMVVWVGNTFRIGRAADAQLVTRFLPRNKANDVQTKRLSKIHVTLRCEGRELLLSDGSGTKPSANGSTFDGKPLSLEDPVRLSEPGELKLADAYSIKIAPLLDDSNGAPAIANLETWNGPNSGNNPLLTGAVLFMPGEKSDVVFTLWLFTTAAFGSNSVSAIDFASSPKIAALHHFRGCFWIEQRSTEPLLLNGLALARGEIAPLAAGQTLEVKGSKYAVQVRDQDKQLKP